MLVLRPSLLSRKPIDQLTAEAQGEAEGLEGAGDACLWIGCGLVAGGLIVWAAGSSR